MELYGNPSSKYSRGHFPPKKKHTQLNWLVVSTFNPSEKCRGENKNKIETTTQLTFEPRDALKGDGALMLRPFFRRFVRSLLRATGHADPVGCRTTVA